MIWKKIKLTATTPAKIPAKLLKCSLPEAKSLLSELIDEKMKVVQKLEQTLNELQEKSHIIDDIAESYNKEVE
jgi:hypothetical protein